MAAANKCYEIIGQHAEVFFHCIEVLPFYVMSTPFLFLAGHMAAATGAYHLLILSAHLDPVTHSGIINNRQSTPNCLLFCYRAMFN